MSAGLAGLLLPGGAVGEESGVMGRKNVGSAVQTRGRGKVRVQEDGAGHQWVVCSGCGLDKFTPGLSPAKFAARKHADSCTR